MAGVIPSGAVVVIDTLNRAAPGSDENAPNDMSKIIAGAKALQIAVDGLVLLVHHSGKDEGRGPRGHSSLLAALDAAIEVKRTGDKRKFKIDKCKDGVDGLEFGFTLKMVDLGTDADGDDITSCVIVPDNSAAIAMNAKSPQGKHQTAVLAKILELLKSAQPIVSVSPPATYRTGSPALAYGASIPSLGAALACASDKRTSNAKAAVEGLAKKGLIALVGDWLWIP